jgi:hypothetical protein
MLAPGVKIASARIVPVTQMGFAMRVFELKFEAIEKGTIAYTRPQLLKLDKVIINRHRAFNLQPQPMKIRLITIRIAC